MNDFVSKISTKIKNYYLENKLFLLFIIISVFIGITLRTITLGFNLYFKAILCDLIVAFLIGTFAYLIHPKKRIYFYMFFIFIFTGLAVGNTIYYQFYQSYISVNLLSTASMIGKVDDSLWAKIHLIQFIYFIYPILFIYLYNNKIKNGNNFNENDNLLKKFLCTFLMCFVFLIFLISIKDLNRLNSQFNRAYIVKKYGLYLYTFNDLIQSASFNNNIEYERAVLKFKEFYSCKSSNREVNEYTNKFKGKNILFIHSESIQNFLIDLKINGNEVTPNLNKFVKEGMYFSRFYPQISVGTSSDTEFSLLTGLMPSSKGTVFVNYFDRTYYSMPKYFNDLGYYTFSMHGNDREYWNRAVMHKNLGYQKFYGKESYDVVNSKVVGLGISDSDFFKQSVDKLKDIKDNNELFFGTIITLSNHSPFNDVENYDEFDVSLTYKYLNHDGEYEIIKRDYLEDTTMGNYLKSSHYADRAFGEFIDALKKEDLLDNTIIVFYGDHEARISKHEFDLLYNYDPENDDILNEDDPSYISLDNYNYDLLRNTPLVIWSNEEDLSNKITSTMGMYDILPTIGNMFGFEAKYALGNDVFSENENIVIFPNGNVLTDKVYYSDLYEEYVAFTSEPISNDYIDRISTYASDVLEVSNGIVNYDLIKKEGNNIGVCYEK